MNPIAFAIQRVFFSVFAATVLALPLPHAIAQPTTPVNPGDSVPRSLPPCGVIFTGDPANSTALCGSSESTDGVIGVSTRRNGIVGTGGKAGVVGTTKKITGHGVQATNIGGGAALSAKTTSEALPAAVFTNSHPTGAHIWAGPPNAPVFEVKSDGRVFVQGTQIGLRGERGASGEKGEKGEKGERGERGAAGSVVRSSVAVCGYTTTCGCSTATVTIAATAAPLGGSCSAAADNGTCQHNDEAAQRGPGVCCVCLPL